MAELGHPVNGPQSIWTLTPAEIRVYAEGLRERADREEDAAKRSGMGPSYDQQSQRDREDEALQRVSEKARQRHYQ